MDDGVHLLAAGDAQKSLVGTETIITHNVSYKLVCSGTCVYNVSVLDHGCLFVACTQRVFNKLCKACDTLGQSWPEAWNKHATAKYMTGWVRRCISS